MHKLFKRSRVAVASVASLGTVGTAMAGTTTDSFDGWVQMLLDWSHGGLGTSIAVAMLLLGAGTGVAKNNPIPALSGVAGAAILKFGPDAIAKVMGYTAAVI